MKKIILSVMILLLMTSSVLAYSNGYKHKTIQIYDNGQIQEWTSTLSMYWNGYVNDVKQIYNGGTKMIYGNHKF
jgi:hypothetical protein